MEVLALDGGDTDISYCNRRGRRERMGIDLYISVPGPCSCHHGGSNGRDLWRAYSVPSTILNAPDIYLAY